MTPPSNILPFPASGPAPVAVIPPAPLTIPALPAMASRQADVGLVEIAQRLGIAGESWRCIIDKVRLLNERYSFPDPRNPRFITHRGERTLARGARAIIRRSLFPRARVEEWFDNFRAPAERVRDDAIEAKTAARELAANAHALVAALPRRTA